MERENLWETMSATSKEKSVMDSVMDSGAALRSDLRSQLQGHVGKGEEGMEESLSLSAETDIVAREAIREEKYGMTIRTRFASRNKPGGGKT